jgi:hypothetical protein
VEAFTLPAGVTRTGQVARIAAFLASLSSACGWVIEIKRLQKRRSDPQNRYLWGVAYPAILKHLPGWEAQDLHDYCLGECHGWERLEGLSRVRLKPLKRSSKLSVPEFMDYVAWIQRTFAEKGIYVPDPNEDMEAAA